jgi:hypothetical protein
VAKKEADSTNKVSVSKKPETTADEKKEKDEELQKTKDILFVAKNNLIKV